ncbi:MAG: S8 family serine peptidase [Lachnospiraceae bacterium]|nr:S8 family serine peptidase [Lachnospiraceae bacterium]
MRRWRHKHFLWPVAPVAALVFFLSLSSLAFSPDNDLTDLQWGPLDMQVPSFDTPDGNMEEEIIVAVIDGGIDPSHPDLQGILYEFSEEEQEALHCTRYGYDAVTKGAADPPADDHATHVAAIIGAAWDGYGISGVCSNVRIISINCSVGDDTPLDYCMEAYAFVIRALDYGIPIRVINNSWGNVDASLAMNHLIEEAGKRGALSIFSAGNYSDNMEDSLFIPASYLHDSPYAVIVGAYNKNGAIADFSNYGETFVDVFAPGVQILSAMSSTYHTAYEYMNGTSMAAPAVTGAAAYLAGNHPEITRADELRTLLLSCTTPLDALAPYYANGIVDLSVEETGNHAPVITSVSFSDQSVTVSGAFFGRREGYVQLIDVTAREEAEIEMEDISWSDDRIRIRCKGPLPSVIKVYVETATTQKHDAAILYTHTSPAVYDTSHTLPKDADLMDVIDAPADYQPAGYLEGIDGYLYYMPLRFLVEDVILGFDRLYRYDYRADSWETLPSLPECVVAAQATSFEGGIFVAGTDAAQEKSLVYYYEPDIGEWHELHAEDVPLMTSAVNRNGTLLLIGGAVFENGMWRALDSILAYDLTKERCTPYGALASPVYAPQAVAGGDTLYIYGSRQTGLTEYEQIFQRMEGDTCEVLPPSSLFPAFRAGEGNRRPKFNVALHGALISVPEGLLLVGPMSEDGLADTYLLRTGEDTFVPLDIRLSDWPAFWPAACAYDGRLFAIARSAVEDGFEIFRSSPMNTYLTYEAPVAEEEEPPEEEPLSDAQNLPESDLPRDNEDMTPVETASGRFSRAVWVIALMCLAGAVATAAVIHFTHRSGSGQ